MELKGESVSSTVDGRTLRSDLSHINLREPLEFGYTSKKGKSVTIKRSEDNNKHGDPFKAFDQQTGTEVELTQHERVTTYYRLGLEPPRYLVRSLEKHTRIRRAKANKKNGRR